MQNKRRLLFGLVLLMPFMITAVKVKQIKIFEFNHFQRGQIQGVILDSRGWLQLGPKVSRIPGPDAEFYLSMAAGKNGGLFIGTGHQGTVYRIDPAGKSEKILQLPQLDIFALAITRNNTLYVGTSPNGQIYRYRIGKDKEPETIVNPRERYIWDIVLNQHGDVIFSVGNSGGIYSIDDKGNTQNIFAPEDMHIIKLYVTRNNSILAGSGDRGVLYQIQDRKVKVLYDSPFEEIRGICEDPQGNIYFSACKSPNFLKPPEEIISESKIREKKNETDPPPPETSTIYRMQSDGVVEKLWTSKDEYIYSLYYQEDKQSVLAATGNSGRLYRIEPDGSYALVYESDAAQIFSMTKSGNQVYLASNNTASISKLENSLNNNGTYLSEIYDLKIQSKIGRIYWDAVKQQNTGVLFFIRSGNSSLPDATWSQWSAPFSDEKTADATAAGRRFFQVKITLNSTNAQSSPQVNGYRVYSIQSNLKPQISAITVNKPGRTIVVKDNKASVVPAPVNTLDVSWKANDPNDDSLKFNLYLKKRNGRQWMLIHQDYEKDKLKLKTDLYEDGIYQLKIVADDQLNNPPSLARSNELISPSFTIDSTAPVIADFSRNRDTLFFKVVDETSIISDVLFSFDRKIWMPLFPDDSINDSTSENFNFKLPTIGNQKTIFIKVIDEFNNYKVFHKEI